MRWITICRSRDILCVTALQHLRLTEFFPPFLFYILPFKSTPIAFFQDQIKDGTCNGMNCRNEQNPASRAPRGMERCWKRNTIKSMHIYVSFAYISVVCYPFVAVTLHLTDDKLSKRVLSLFFQTSEGKTKRGYAFLLTPMNKKLPKPC